MYKLILAKKQTNSLLGLLHKREVFPNNYGIENLNQIKYSTFGKDMRIINEEGIFTAASYIGDNILVSDNDLSGTNFNLTLYDTVFFCFYY